MHHGLTLSILELEYHIFSQKGHDTRLSHARDMSGANVYVNTFLMWTPDIFWDFIIPQLGIGRLVGIHAVRLISHSHTSIGWQKIPTYTCVSQKSDHFEFLVLSNIHRVLQRRYPTDLTRTDEPRCQQYPHQCVGSGACFP